MDEERRVEEESERQRQLKREAKVELERLKTLEEKESQRLAAEAKMASMLGISRPFESGARGQAGVVVVRWIPAGWYIMGSPISEEGRDSNEIQHEVVLTRGFFMAETECTQAQWKAVMGSNPSEFKGADRPVELVSWEEAVDYCRKLTAKQRAEGILPDGWESSFKNINFTK